MKSYCFSFGCRKSSSWLLALLLSPLTGIGAVLYVDANNGSPTPPYLSWSTAAQTIQDAVDASGPGDEIVVTNGLYATGGRPVFGSMTNRVVVNKPIFLHSVNGAKFTFISGRQIPGTTNGDGAIRCVYLTNGAVLAGFTLSQGATRKLGDFNLEKSGGGVWSESGGVVSNCVIAGNQCAANGGGAYGGTLYGCVIASNSNTNYGGGCYSSTLYNCTVSLNSGIYGGGAAYASLNNCIVYSNSGLFGNNYLNSTFNYCCTTPQPSSGNGNITNDPLLVDPANGNLRLQSNSPCINAGDNASAPTGTDLDGNARILGAKVDLGAYEFPGTNSPIEPFIITHPTNQTVTAGSTATFIVTAGGSSPLSYQWRFYGTNLTGAPTNVLVLTNVQPPDAGNYFAVVTNSYGSATSSVAVLSITTGGPPTSIYHYVDANSGNPVAPYTNWGTAAHTIQDAVDVSPAGHEIIVTNGLYDIGGRAGHGFAINRVSIDRSVSVRSVNGPQVTIIQGHTASDGAPVRCAYLTNGASLSGFTLTGGATLSSGTQSLDQSGAGAYCEYSAVLSNCVVTKNFATWDGGGVYNGIVNNCVIIGNSANDGGGGATGSRLNNCLVISNSVSGGYGGGAFGGTINNCTVVSNSAYFGAGGIAFSDGNNSIVYFNTAPNNPNYQEGSYTLNYCCTTPQYAGGNGNISSDPLFQDLAGGNLRLASNSPCIDTGSNAYAPAGLDLDSNPRIVGSAVDIGAYEFQGTNFFVAPYILSQPANQSVTAGFNATFSIAAGGTSPLNYLWWFNGTNFLGTPGSFLTLTNVQPSNAGNYSVIVTNAYGSVTSSIAVLTVSNLAPYIISQPTNRIVGVGSNVTFRVTAGGSSPLKYQWLFYGTNLNGFFTNVLNLTNVQTANAGPYSVRVTNAYGWATSSIATLTVTNQPPPPLPATRYVNVNSINPTAPYTNWGTAAATIQDAVDASVSGDEIVVTNGVYSAGGKAIYGQMTNRVAVDKVLYVHSANGPEVTLIQGRQVPGTTNGDGAIRCVYLTNNATLSGFTLTNGATRTAGDANTERNGGGIWCAYYSTATISNCLITGNSADSIGGGVYGGSLNHCTISENAGGAIAGCTANDCIVSNNFGGFYGGGANSSTLTNCLLTFNRANNAGGAYGGTLMRCILKGNVAQDSGGGAQSAFLYDCLLTGNSAQNFAGGAYACYLYSCTIISNSAPDTGGISIYTNGYAYNCIIYFNTAGSHSNYVDTFGGHVNYCCTIPAPSNGAGNITSDPLLVDLAGGNLRLASNSPCINSGNNSYATAEPDLDGNLRIVAGVIDMGAYEFQGPFPHGTRYVNLNNPTPSPPYTNWGSAANTIQDAIDAATPGDEVVVTNGTYSAGGKIIFGSLQNRVAVDKPLWVHSVNGPQFTIIDGIGVMRCAYLTNGASLSGFTVTTGDAPASGGGIWAESSNVLISNCVVTECSAGQYGGGVFSGTLYNCTLYYNSAGNGAGAYSSTLNNCLVNTNWASFNGAGAYSCTLNNCSLVGNSGGYGGGAYQSTLNNCTLTRNRGFSPSGGAAYQSALNNCISFFNDDYNYDFSSVLNYCCVSPAPASGVGNISFDPRFVDWAGGNLRLQTNSPCIDAGLNTYVVGSADLDGNPRVGNDRVDMGAYEYQGGPVPPYILSQPQGQTVLAGTNVTFSVGVIGAFPLAYQWNLGGTSLNSATNSALTLTNVQVNQSGDYQVIITNIAGTATSSVAHLTVNPAPVSGTHYVDVGSVNPVFPFTDWSTAATNIQDAVDAAAVGDEIVVTNGVYSHGGSSGYRVSIQKNVLVRSVNGPRWTLIDSSGNNSGVYLTSAKISGFTITNGYGGVYGGTVSNCIVAGNSGTGVNACSVFNSIIKGNSGGGASFSTLNNCLVTGNTASLGGGAYMTAMNNCTVVSNTATSSGGGIWSTNGPLNNCIIYYNTAPASSNWGGSGFRAGPAPQSYCCTTPDSGGIGNITNEPVFIDLANGNLRLQSNSPCIDAGTNALVVGTTDLDGRPRIQGGRVDIGAYEFQPDVSGAFIAWLQQAGLPTDGSADAADSDGDGLSNQQEYSMGRNPIVWDNVRLANGEMTAEGSYQLSVVGQPGAQYILQGSANLRDWTPLMTVSCAGSNGTSTVVDSTCASYSQRFYRLAPFATMPAPKLSVALSDTNGTRSVTLKLEGFVGFNYRVEASTDLAEWSLLQSFVSTNTVMSFQDNDAASFDRRFYRAVLP